LLILSLEHPLPYHKRLPTGGRGMYHHPKRPLQLLHRSPKRQVAPHTHQGLVRMR